jgi:hypothetical protein
MKIYTFFTDTHKIFLDTFIESFPFEENFDLEIKYFPQECNKGVFESDGWDRTMKKKIEYILYSLEQTNDGDIFIHSDIDIQFFSNIKEDLLSYLSIKEVDILFQRDDFRKNSEICMGFFVCKSNERTKSFFKYVYDNLNNYKNDQIAVNNLIHSFPIKYDLLPEKYYTVGLRNGLWNGQENIIVPEDILLHHANFTIGIQNKLNLLKLVKNKVIK